MFVNCDLQEMQQRPFCLNFLQVALRKVYLETFEQQTDVIILAIFYFFLSRFLFQIFPRFRHFLQLNSLFEEKKNNFLMHMP